MKTLLISVVLLFSMSPLSAQERLTLDAAVTTAIQKNQALRAAAFDRDAGDWGKLNAVTNFLPKVELSGGVTRIDPASERRANAAVDFIKAAAGTLGIPQEALSEIKPFAYRDTYSTDLIVVQPIYNGGAEIVGLSAANAMQDRSEYSYHDTEQDVVATVKMAFYTVLKAQELVGLCQEAVGRTKRHLEMINRRAEAGMRTKTDVLRWEVELAADEGNLVNAQNGLSLARLQLNNAMGVNMDADFELQKPEDLDSAAVTPMVPPAATERAASTSAVRKRELSQEFLESHPSMQVMQANLRLADAGIDQAWVNFKPSVNLAFQYGWEKNDTPRLDGITPWAIAVQVRWPIFNSFGDYTRLQKARAEYHRTESQVESFRRGLLMQATGAELTLRSALKRIEITRRGQQEAQDVLNAVTRRYETGGASNVDLIDVQTAYTSARASFIAALYDCRIAEVQLDRALGKVTP
jgi:outer membrane protein